MGDGAHGATIRATTLRNFLPGEAAHKAHSRSSDPANKAGAHVAPVSRWET